MSESPAAVAPAPAASSDESIKVDSELSVKDALNIITSYLPVEWTNVNEDDIKISRISGGYMNTVYLVERTSESINEPNQLILRRKGGGIVKVDRSEHEAASDIMASEVEEVVITLAAAEATVGPTVHGIFSGGRLEEYVNSHTLTPQDVLNESISKDVARALARFHSMRVPYRRASFQRIRNLVSNSIGQFQANINYLLDPVISTIFADAPGPIDWDYLKSFDFAGEFHWVSKILDQVTYRMVITTADPNYLNVLVRDSEAPPGKLKVVLVDYELAVYQPRGIELGGHFANRTVGWGQKVNKASGYDVLPCEERKKFIDQYTEEIHRLNKLDNLDASERDSSAQIMREADVGMLYYLLQFSFFITSNLGSFVGDKSFPTGAVVNLQTYMQMKQLLTKKYPQWTQ